MRIVRRLLFIFIIIIKCTYWRSHEHAWRLRFGLLLFRWFLLIIIESIVWFLIRHCLLRWEVVTLILIRVAIIHHLWSSCWFYSIWRAGNCGFGCYAFIIFELSWMIYNVRLLLHNLLVHLLRHHRLLRYSHLLNTSWHLHHGLNRLYRLHRLLKLLMLLYLLNWLNWLNWLHLLLLCLLRFS